MATQQGSRGGSVRGWIARYAIPLAAIMLVVWLAGTLLEGPGWVHLLLTLGVTLLIYGIVVRGTPEADRRSPDA